MVDFEQGISSITIRPEMLTQMIREQVFCVTDVRAIRILVLVGAFTEKSLYGGARITSKQLLPESPV